MTLAAIAARAQDQLDGLIDQPFDDLMKHRVHTIMAEYVRAVHARFGIELEPALAFNARTGCIILDARPKTDFDKAMLLRLQDREAA